SELKKNKLKIYTARKKKNSFNELSHNIPSDATYWNFPTLLDVSLFVQDESTRVIEFPISLKRKPNKVYALNVGVRHGLDDSGDKGLYVKVLDINKNQLISFYSSEKGWKWDVLENLNQEDFIVSIEDLDTSFKNMNSGNKAQIKVNLVEKLM
ncbi:hypothetical protein, partial [Shewanella sp. KT0246]|uniref:hypothetical protein n=1 Tax=Shewanella sp. KT0246 TaxID=2815912 RepID=UPI001C7D2B39